MTEILEFAVGTMIGNIATALTLVLAYYNFLLFEDYIRVIIWSILFSQALRGAKERIVQMLRYLSKDKEIAKNVSSFYILELYFYTFVLLTDMQGAD